MVEEDVRVDPSTQEMEEIQDDAQKKEMMDGLNTGGDAPPLDVKQETENSNLSLSFSCSSNMLASSNQIFFGHHQTQLISALAKKPDVFLSDQYDSQISSKIFQIRSQKL